MSGQPFYESAYGGDGWSPRNTSLSEELGTLWANSGMSSEYKRLKSVVMHRPGEELGASAEPDKVLMLAPLDLPLAQQQHDGIAAAYRAAGVTVHYVEPEGVPTPNQMFCADLMVMTPEGAIIARPAGTVRAGEERWVARRLADIGVPIVRSIRGNGTFEGADLMWLNPKTAMIGRGMRTNDEGAAQLVSTLNEMGVEAIVVDLPFGTMHLMGMLRFLDGDLVIARHKLLVHRAIEALHRHGYKVVFAPDLEEANNGSPLNFVTLGPREILMADGNPNTQAFIERHDVKCHTVPVHELRKAAGAIGCLTGIVEREK